MGIETYYLSKQEVSGIGSIFLMNELIEAENGGEALLGAVVQENKKDWHKDYLRWFNYSREKTLCKMRG